MDGWRTSQWARDVVGSWLSLLFFSIKYFFPVCQVHRSGEAEVRIIAQMSERHITVVTEQGTRFIIRVVVIHPQSSRLIPWRLCADSTHMSLRIQHRVLLNQGNAIPTSEVLRTFALYHMRLLIEHLGLRMMSLTILPSVEEGLLSVGCSVLCVVNRIVMLSLSGSRPTLAQLSIRQQVDIST